MRSGGYTLQQALTAEATSMVKQAVVLAKRRGHAQVTPLHVANTMLSSSSGILRTACLQSHSHPLQCKALELCFNVALNRLPVSSSSTLFSPYAHHPSLSNALVAAFKRAQAHQRRGSIENQQQPLLAIKVELEQLIISILDDPSVSRVMREAGFSSTQVKNSVEKVVSLEISSRNSHKLTDDNHFHVSSSLVQLGFIEDKDRSFDQVRKEDVTSVIDNLIQRRGKGIVIVGECLAKKENIIRNVAEKFERGDVPEILKNVQFISFPFFTFGQISKEEIEEKIEELRRMIKRSRGLGVVLYIGDLKWIVDFREKSHGQFLNYSTSTEKIIMEVGELICQNEELAGFSLLGISTYQTYMKCRFGHPSLQEMWRLHPLPMPAGSLGLSLNLDSDSQVQLRSKRTLNGFGLISGEEGENKQISYCNNFSKMFETKSPEICTKHTVTSKTTPWLQLYKEDGKISIDQDQGSQQVQDLCKKWNSICDSMDKHQRSTEGIIDFSFISPSSSVSSYEQDDQNYQSPLLQSRCPWRNQSVNANLNLHLPSSSSDAMEIQYQKKFNEVNAENLKILCHELEKKISWQKNLVPEISSTLLKCRSGMVRRKTESPPHEIKEETWLLFEGKDTHGKEKMGRELATLVFGTQSSFVSIESCRFSSTRSDSSEDSRIKRVRSERESVSFRKFAEVVKRNPHRVFLMEDIDHIDYDSLMGLKLGIETGRLRDFEGEELPLKDAIIVFCSEGSDKTSRTSSPSKKQRLECSEETEPDDEGEKRTSFSLDLNLSVEVQNTHEQLSEDLSIFDLVDGRFNFEI